MKLDYLQKILGHVKSGLTCPRCQKPFGSAEVKIVSIREKDLDVAVDCPHCHTAARISAQITAQPNSLKHANADLKAQLSTTTPLTAENLEVLKREITHLSSSDIAGLTSL